MKLPRLLAAIAICACVAVPQNAPAQQNAFQFINRAGRAIGHGSYKIDRAKDGGFRVQSKFEYRLGIASEVNVPENGDTSPGAARGSIGVTDYQLTADYKAAADGSYLSGYLQNAANQMITSLQPSKARTEITIGGVQGGVQLAATTLTSAKTDYLLLPEYDPAAFQVLLTAVLAHPHADNVYTIIVPTLGPRGGAIAAGIALAPNGTPQPATLDGKVITVKRYELVWAKGKGAIYADDSGTLMQVDVATTKTSLVRNGFVVAPPA